MPQTLAALIRPPQVDQFDLSTPLLRASQISAARSQNRLADFQVGQAEQGQKLLSDYSQANAAGDPRAVDKLAARPDIQAQVLQARNALNEVEKREFDTRTTRIAKAAQEVSVVTDPARKTQVWNEKLDELKSEGLLDETQYRSLYGKPDDEVIKRAIAGGTTVEQFIALQQAEASRKAGLEASRALGAAMGGRGDYFSTIKAKESGGNAAAKSPTSSATGLYQFTAGTWNDLATRHPDLGLTDVKDPVQQERAMRVFTAENIDSLIGEDIAPTDRNLRVAHFLGAGGAAKFVRAMDTNPGSKAVDFVSPEAARANKSVFYHPDGRPRTVKGAFGVLTKGMSDNGSAVAGLMPAETGTMVGGVDTGKLVPMLAQLASMPGIPKETQTVALELMKNALGQNKPTPDMTEYREMYVPQETAAGREPKDFTTWMRENKKSAAANINVAGGDIGLGKKAQGELQTSLIQGQEQIARLNNIRSSFKSEYQQLPYKAGMKLTQIKSWLGRDLSDAERTSLSEFSAYKRQALSNISLAIKELTGAAMSLPEAERIKGTQPDAGDGMFDGDDPVTFKSKLDDTMKSTMRAVARQHYVLTKGIPGKPWEVMGLDEVDDLINERGNALLEELKAANPGANDADLQSEVLVKLKQEFGIGFEGAQ